MKFEINDKLGFAVEMAASVFTVAGIWYGSTTLPGAIMYAISMIFWFWIGYRKKLWGIMPLNVFSTLVIAKNLYFLV